MSEIGYCLLVPHYNHVRALSDFLPKLQSTGLPCIVVDDGSQAEQLQDLTDLLADVDGFELVKHDQNQGKGAAMMTGAKVARQRGFTHILQIDADGQHEIADVQKFLEYSKDHPSIIVSGAPIFAADAPKARVYGRKVTDFWVALETLSLNFKDSLCGFRVYPLEQFEQVVAGFSLGNRMDFDTEVLVKSVWLGSQVHFIPTKVRYIENNVSHFHYLQDNLSLIYLHIRLMLGMLIRLPKLLFWRLKGHSASSR
jgi:glycosyltransferase involved in cell wall biosynthesis